MMNTAQQIIAQFASQQNLIITDDQIDQLAQLLSKCTQPATSKTQAAKQYLLNNPGIGRKAMIEYMVDKLGFTHSGASTTYQNLKQFATN